MTAKKYTKWKSAIFLTVGLLMLLLGYWGWRSYHNHLRLMENIKLAMANPSGLNPGALVSRIDSGFAALPVEEKHRILADPKLLSERIEKASYRNYKQAFGSLFLLPAPIRQKLIRNSADAIISSLTKNPDKVNAFYESEAGKAALRAAYNYFLTEFDGRQKSELKPITDAFFEIHKTRARE